MAAKDQDFLDFVLDQLSGLAGVVPRRMFGAIGLYQDDVFFALIDDGRLYFVTDETTRRRYVERDMGPFEYAPGKLLRTYYEVPVDVLEDDRALAGWANQAVGAQKAREAARVRKKRTASHRSAGARRK